MFRPLMWLILLTWLLSACNVEKLYTPYTLRHPKTGATVTCGHWVWWECEAFSYTKRGYRQFEASR